MMLQRNHIRLSRRSRLEITSNRMPSKGVVAALVFASASLMALSNTGAIDPLKSATADFFGPAESTVSSIARPITALPRYLKSKSQLENQVASLSAQNTDLRAQVNRIGYDRNRLNEYVGLSSMAANLGYNLVPAHVIAYGPAQSFTRTVTIDAGADSGIKPGETVVAAQGLVGRVVTVTAGTATVLLAVDSDSYVGSRLGDSMKLGFVRGDGVLSGGGTLNLQLLDQSAVPRAGDVVMTWGDGRSGPYISGVPIGTVAKVYASLTNSLRSAVVVPYVDFSALDEVGVAVPVGTKTIGDIFRADGKVGP